MLHTFGKDLCAAEINLYGCPETGFALGPLGASLNKRAAIKNNPVRKVQIRMQGFGTGFPIKIGMTVARP